jgi:hypothetical protein
MRSPRGHFCKGTLRWISKWVDRGRGTDGPRGGGDIYLKSIEIAAARATRARSWHAFAYAIRACWIPRGFAKRPSGSARSYRKLYAELVPGLRAGGMRAHCPGVRLILADDPSVDVIPEDPWTPDAATSRTCRFERLGEAAVGLGLTYLGAACVSTRVGARIVCRSSRLNPSVGCLMSIR